MDNNLQGKTVENPLKPMPILQAFSFFGVPALLFFIGSHVIYPQLVQTSLSEFDSLVVTATVPFALMIPATIYFYVRDGYPIQWRAFWQRMRFSPFRWRYGWWVLAILLVSIPLAGIGQVATRWLLNNGLMTVPAYVPILLNQMGSDVDFGNPDVWQAFVGSPIHHNWRVVSLFFVMIFFNNVGEELWWRGYILPRQIAAHGRWTWLIHGILWSFFHIWKWWDIPTIWPLALSISYAAQRTRSSWPSFVAHFMVNGLGFLLLLSIAIGNR